MKLMNGGNNHRTLSEISFSVIKIIKERCLPLSFSSYKNTNHMIDRSSISFMKDERTKTKTCTRGKNENRTHNHAWVMLATLPFDIKWSSTRVSDYSKYFFLPPRITPHHHRTSFSPQLKKNRKLEQSILEKPKFRHFSRLPWPIESAPIDSCSNRPTCWPASLHSPASTSEPSY